MTPMAKPQKRTVDYFSPMLDEKIAAPASRNCIVYLFQGSFVACPCVFNDFVQML
jgi:hypothetical protein